MRLTKMLIILVLGGFSVLAAAGTKTNTAVYIATSWGFAEGGLSSARYSSNGLEYISCDSYSSGYLTCSARDASGVSAYCSTSTTSSPAFAGAIAGMNSASFVAFWWDTTSGACTNILLRNGSNYLP